MSEPLDEAALRRPDFTEGHRVTLGDGQEWSFPKVRFSLHPTLAADGSLDVKQGPPYGRGYQAELEEFLGGEAEESQQGRLRQLQVRIALAAKLLLRNYALDGPALETLLEWTVESDVGMWQAIDAVMMGFPPQIPRPEDPDVAPKPSPAGSAAPS